MGNYALKGQLHTQRPNLHTESRLLPRIACTFLCNIQKIGSQRHKPFLLLSNHFLLLQREIEYVWVILEKILLSENEYGHIRSECRSIPTLTTSLPAGGTKKMTSTSQGLPSVLSQPPVLHGSVTFRVKEGILVFNSLDYSLINGLFLQIKIQIRNKPIPFAHICPYQYSVWWVNMPQWADSLFCLCTAVMRGEGGVRTGVSLLCLVVSVHKDLCQHSRLSEPGNSQPFCKPSHGAPLAMAAIRTRGRNVWFQGISVQDWWELLVVLRLALRGQYPHSSTVPLSAVGCQITISPTAEFKMWDLRQGYFTMCGDIFLIK